MAMDVEFISSPMASPTDGLGNDQLSALHGVSAVVFSLEFDQKQTISVRLSNDITSIPCALLDLPRKRVMMTVYYTIRRFKQNVFFRSDCDPG